MQKWPGPTHPWGALARLGLARAYAMHDTVKARAASTLFLGPRQRRATLNEA